MIDRHFQNKGYGTEALQLILSQLQRERKYEIVEVCVNRDDTAALKMYQKLGSSDTGYVDESCPDCQNLRYHLCTECMRFSDTLISDFSNPLFQDAFRQYFSELNIHVADCESLFREMNEEDNNLSFVRTTEKGEIIGFVLFQPTKFTNWFFEETYGFIREFWVASTYRNAGHGTALIQLAEKYFCDNDIFTCILTSDTAERFYKKHGYIKTPGCKAKNQDDVLIKHLV